MKPIFILFGCVYLCGCSQGIQVFMSDDLKLEEEKHRGFLVTTLGATTTWPETGKDITTTLHIRQLGKENSPTIKVINNNSKFDFQYHNTVGQLISLPLPIGHYEIYQVTFLGSNGQEIVRNTSKNNLALSFTIQENTASYIGEFIASSRTTKSKQWNTFYPNGNGYLQHGYHESRDSELFYKNYPNLNDIDFQRINLSSIWDNTIYTNILDNPPLFQY